MKHGVCVTMVISILGGWQTLNLDGQPTNGAPPELHAGARGPQEVSDGFAQREVTPRQARLEIEMKYREAAPTSLILILPRGVHGPFFRLVRKMAHVCATNE